LFDPFHPESGPATAARVATRTAYSALLVPAMLGAMVSAERSYSKRLFDAVMPIRDQTATNLVLNLVLYSLGGLVIGGLAVLTWRRAWLPVGLVVATLGMICLSPWPDQFKRYLTPLVPVLSVALVLAVCRGVAVARRRDGRLVAAGATLA